MDIMLPKINGFEVVKMIRAEGDRTPVLFLTARDTVEDIVHGLDIGGNDYLIKPFSFEELLARIRVITRNKRPYPCRSQGGQRRPDRLPRG